MLSARRLCSLQEEDKYDINEKPDQGLSTSFDKAPLLGKMQNFQNTAHYGNMYTYFTECLDQENQE
jgi:hypothetical protein